MAKHSLTNSHPELNLSNRKTVWLQNTVKVGNRMADALRILPSSFDGELALADDWCDLMTELVEMML